jgi:hypothetical protein
MSAETIDFPDLEPKEAKVTLRGQKYLLREASADAVLKYRAAMMRGSRGLNLTEGFSPDKLSGPQKVEMSISVQDAEVILAANCLYRADEDGTVPVIPPGVLDPRRLIDEVLIRQFPSHVLSRLIDWVKQNSDELADKPDLSKNGQGATVDTSA